MDEFGANFDATIKEAVMKEYMHIKHSQHAEQVQPTDQQSRPLLPYAVQCHWGQVQGNLCKQVTIGFSFISDNLRKWCKIF